MITQSQATRVLSEFEADLERIGYEQVSKTPLTTIFGYLKIRCADFKIYSGPQKLKAVEALERRWQQDRIGKPILADYGEGVIGFDPAGTECGALTIGAILRELRCLLSEFPETLPKPQPEIWPAMLAPGLRVSTIDDAVARALAARDALKRETVSA
jgi:hypothetical protein